MTSPVTALADYRRQPVFRTAVETFFASKELRPNSRRAYEQTLTALGEDLGWELAVDRIAAESVEAAFLRRWGHEQGASPRTWNAHRVWARSFMAFCWKRNWLTDDPMVLVEGRRIPRDDTKAITPEALDKLWCRRDVDLREKTLWRRLYETAARANEILALNIEDLDLARKRATIVGKGGHRQRVYWSSGTARLLPRYVAGRKRGPLFLTHRQSQVIVSGRDLCLDTGRARLTYHQAARVFKRATAKMAESPEGGWTLHQLRYSCLTHLAQDSVNIAQLQAKSRHDDRWTLDRYIRLGDEAAVAVTRRLDTLLGS